MIAWSELHIKLLYCKYDIMLTRGHDHKYDTYFVMYVFDLLFLKSDYSLFTHHKCLATLDGEIVDPEITAKLEMRDVLKVHDAQT